MILSDDSKPLLYNGERNYGGPTLHIWPVKRVWKDRNNQILDVFMEKGRNVLNQRRQRFFLLQCRCSSQWPGKATGWYVITAHEMWWMEDAIYISPLKTGFYVIIIEFSGTMFLNLILGDPQTAKNLGVNYRKNCTIWRWVTWHFSFIFWKLNFTCFRHYYWSSWYSCHSRQSHCVCLTQVMLEQLRWDEGKLWLRWSNPHVWEQGGGDYADHMCIWTKVLFQIY